ncbi:hypothetical protein [Azospirillum sp.]|uniref:hypothetical protein n=1 Tax=Azospirillum sp. TaxID=34012 RepID=UPI003D75B1A5
MAALDMSGSTAPAGRVREAVAVFDDPDRLDGAVAELQQCGFNRADLSIADGERCRTLGIAYTDAREIEDNPKVPRTVFISKASVGDAEGVLIGGAVYLGAVVAAGVAAASGVGITGTIAVVTVAAALTGAVGLYLRGSVHRRYVGTIHEQVRHGGIVLWVNLHSPEQEQCALGILNRCAAKRVHVHEVPAL